MEFHENMLAYCGLYCEQCSFKLAHDDNSMKHLEHIPAHYKVADLSEYDCPGCKGANICGPCDIKDCAAAKNLDSCADCNSFPCGLIDSFANDGAPHHAEGVNNLYAIRMFGTEGWFETLRPKLYCKCGERQSWYYSCPKHN